MVLEGAQPRPGHTPAKAPFCGFRPPPRLQPCPELRPSQTLGARVVGTRPAAAALHPVRAAALGTPTDTGACAQVLTARPRPQKSLLPHRHSLPSTPDPNPDPAARTHATLGTELQLRPPRPADAFEEELCLVF